MSIVQQLPALIGVAVGALASYLASSATERARWRREQSSRWDDRRAQAYAEYGYAVKNVYVQCQRLVEVRAKGGDSQAAMGEALAELDRLNAERTAKWEPVLLLGNPATIAAVAIQQASACYSWLRGRCSGRCGGMPRHAVADG